MSYCFNSKLKIQTAKFSRWSVLSLSILLALGANRVNALPGQSPDTVVSWINANPTLRPGIGEGLLVRKFNTPAQRFTFKATVLPPGQVSTPIDRATIRSERISFYDMINGVTPDRLKESLRIIYGLGIYQDYTRAKLVYVYPTAATIDLARRENRPLLAAQQGELSLGERYAYWMEVTKTNKGKAYNGELTVFLKEDLPKLELQLRNRQ